MIKEKLNDEIIEALLDALPFELTVIDADDRILGWNKHETRLFKRGKTVLGKDVRACHAPSSISAIDLLLDQLKSGENDRVEFWIDGHPKAMPGRIWVVYSAIRDTDGRYLGCVETTQVIGQPTGDVSTKKGL